MLQGSLVLPRRIKVKELVSGRYRPGERPELWDDRFAALEIVNTDSGEEIALLSSGGQSTPAPGWELLLRSGSEIEGSGDVTGKAFSWTLYGIAAN